MISPTVLPISVTVVTLNEERNLRRCLESLDGIAAEIVVVDSGSTDGTRMVAESFGARWSERSWGGFQAQKQAALDLCRHPWVLNLDADESLSPELLAEIREFFASGEHERWGAANFPRKVFFLGRWITHGDWYPDRTLRLFRREDARSGGSWDHDSVELPAGAKVKAMRADLLHDSFPTMHRFLEKMPVFSDGQLRRELERGGRWRLLPTLFRPWWRFFRAYVIRGGFLDGFPGFWIATATAFQTFVRYSRLYEHERRTGGPKSKT